MVPSLILVLLVANTAPAQDSLNMSLLDRWHVDTLPPTALYDNTYNAVWGYARDGREYGIIGSTMGTHIIDVTVPTDIFESFYIPGAYQGPNVVHREFKTYRDRLYAVTDEGPGTLQIIDLRWLPDSAPVLYDSGVLFQRAHTLWIDTANARLYTHYGTTEFAIYSLADPDAPVELLDAENDISWWGQVGGVHDAYTVNNICYTNDVNAMHIIDFTNVASPVLLGTLDVYPQPGYNHSGWLHDNGWLYVMADETHGTDLKLFDVSDPSDIQFIDTIGVELHPLSIAHNPCFKGDQLHVAYYYDGYWLWDCTDPANCQLLGFYDTSLEPHAPSYEGAWGVYPYLPSGIVLVSDMQRGLFVIDISQALQVDGAEPEVAPRVWPTITDGTVNISLPSGAGGEVRVFDAAGKAVLRSTLAVQHSVVDLRDREAGMYLLRITVNGITSTRRVIRTEQR